MELPVVDAPQDLGGSGFLPFKALNGLPMGMTAHLVYSRIDDRPATLSPVMMQVIREEIGFDGLVMTDDISMKALSGSLEDIAAGSIEAGCDVVLLCNATLDERRVPWPSRRGNFRGASEARAARAIAARQTPTEVDIPALEAKLDALISRRGDG